MVLQYRRLCPLQVSVLGLINHNPQLFSGFYKMEAWLCCREDLVRQKRKFLAGERVCPDQSPFKNPALCCRPRWGRGGGEERRLWKAIYLLTPYAMFSKLSSLWEEEEDEERPLLVDNLITKGSCEVNCPDCQCSRKVAHGFCH